MNIYVIILLVLMVLSLLECFIRIGRREKKYIMLVISLLFIFLSTIRTTIAGDYFTYKEVFDYMCNAGSLSKLWDERNWFYEPLYSLLMFISKSFVNSFPFFLFILISIVSYLQFKVVLSWGDKISDNEKRNSYELTAYFILWTLYFGNIFVIRSTVALLFCLYSLRYLEKKKLLRFLVFVGIAAMFHYSAVVFAFAYPIYYYRGGSGRKLFWFFAGSLLGIFFFDTIIDFLTPFLPTVLSIKVRNYFMGEVDYGMGLEGGITILLVKAVLNIGVIMIICFMVYKKTGKRDEMSNGYINLYFIGAITYLSTMFQSFAFARIAIYYNIFQFPLFLLFFKYYVKGKSRLFYWCVFAVYVTLRFGVNLYTGRTGYLPFTTIWEGN